MGKGKSGFSKVKKDGIPVLGKLAALGAIGALGAMGIKSLSRFAVNQASDSFLKKITSEEYDQNLYEVVSSTLRIHPQVILETELRAETGKLLERPMGSTGMFPGLEDIKFNVAQIETLPSEIDTEVDCSVTIGRYAKKPLTTNHFMMLAPMAYGIALSKPVKMALAKGCEAAGVIYHTGAGAIPSDILNLAGPYIFQYGRGNWPAPQDALLKSQAVEIQFGQGAFAGVGFTMESEYVREELRKELKLKKGSDLVTHSRQAEVQNSGQLKKLVEKLRTVTDGVPIGVKIAAGRDLERDLAWICDSEVDFIVLDGAEAATIGSPPILQDDFGIPTAFAVHRAAKWMEQNGVRERISLIASGRIRTPGDALKVKALGADACQIGSIALVAVSHGQVHKALPFEPPTSLVWYDGDAADQFDVKAGARSFQNFMNSCKLEMEDGIRALGKTSISQIDQTDLVTTNEMYAKGLDIPMVYVPSDPLDPKPPRVWKLKL